MSDIVASAVTSKKPLQQLLDTYLPIVSECRIHFDDDGFHVRAIDSATVAYAETDLYREAFESYDSPGEVVIGVNLNALSDRIDAADSGDVIKLAVDMETRKLHIEFRNIEQKLRLIDPNSIRQEPDEPGVDLPNSFTIEGSAFREVYEVAEKVSDHVEIHAEPDEKRVVMKASQDDDEVSVEFDRDDTIDADVNESAMSMYSLRYFDSLSDPIPADAEVTLTFGEENPLFIDWEATDGHQETRQFLAPRLQSR